MPEIEILYSPGCGATPATEALVREVVAALAPGSSVRLTDATSHPRGMARFAGSPTVRVDDRDLEDAQPIHGFGQRRYEGGGAPPRWLVEAAVLRSLRPRHLLFLCVANSARSQLAEGIARSLAAADVRVSSAGSEPGRIRPEAVATLAELGIDATGQHSKGLDAIDLDAVDAVVTLCAEEVCPIFPRAVPRLHWGLPDPAGHPEGIEAFRRVARELQRRLVRLF